VNQDRSARYHKLKRIGAAAALAWSGGLLLVLLLTPGSVLLREAAERLVWPLALPGSATPTAVVVVYVLLLGSLHEAGSLPLAWYRGYALEHRYGLSTETLQGWLFDQFKGLLVGAVFSLVAIAALYLAISRWPHHWWLPASAGFVSVTVVVARLAPVVLLPIFFTFKPLQREELRKRLLSLSERAGVRVLDACEWRLSDRTRKANAALAGIGRTRRILVSDTLLANHSDDEIEVVLAHEIGHHVRLDIWKGIALEGLLAAVAFFLASRALHLLWEPLGWEGVADPAGLPCVLLAGGALSALLLPLGNTLSRHLERQADRYALELSGNAAAFASAMRRLAVQNLAEERPSTLALWLFHSHPPVEERIAAARAWEGTERRPSEVEKRAQGD
jgi:STE24 endopeptidase